EHICELGKELDPSNALYRPGGQPTQARAAPAAGNAHEDGFGAQATQTIPVAASTEKPVDLDLDLDFSIGDDAPAAPPPDTASHPTLKMERALAAEQMPVLDMDFGIGTAAVEPPAVPALPTKERPDPARLDAPNLNVSGSALSFTATEPIRPQVSAAPPAADGGMIEFDLGALSLDLDSASDSGSSKPARAAARAPVVEEAVDSTAGAPLTTAGLEDEGGDPLATKLALAQEFNAIGDPDGARSLAEEVVAEASGDLKQKAQRFLAEIT
ncbi:MAG TPA: FimV/HubP family polar landmark protein, partial [Ramlibacter sp.]|nr:FimV/HubP family polar landmark protein [Ramlibacter sp.]